MKNTDQFQSLNRQLTEKQIRLQTIFDLSPAGIGITRLSDGTMVELNDALLEIIGYKREEVIGRTSAELSIWEDLDERARVFVKIGNGEAIHETSSRVRRKNGERRYVKHSATVCPAPGEMLMIETVRDVTDEYLADCQRQIVEKHLRLSLDVMPITVFHQDLDLRYTFLTNPRIPRPIESIVGHFDQDIFGEQDARAITEIKRRVLASGIRERCELPIHLDGQDYWFDLLIDAERDSGGAIIGLVGVSADITERKQREERYRTVLEDQTELIARYRPDGILVYVNEIYCRFFGKTAAQLIGHSWQPVAHPDDVSLVEEELAGLSPSNPVVTIENRVYAADGCEHWMQFVNRGFFDTSGLLLELQSVGRDITARKKLEASLAEYRTKLQELFEDSDRIRDSQRKEIAREIHDQLGALHLSIGFRVDSLMHKTRDNSAVQAELENVRRLVAQAHASTRAICTALRPPVLDDLGLGPACQWYLEDWSARIGVKARGRFLPPDERLPEQLCSDLFRVFQELLTNVAKHSAATRVSVSLTHGGRGLRLRVADNGNGFSSDTGAHKYGLLGVTERVARYGGHVAIKSEKSGAVVTITIPSGGLK